MHKFLRILSLLFVLICSTKGIAQHRSFIHYTSEEGLPHSQIFDIIQDSKGFIWFASSGGVSRFDGKTFESFSTLNGLVNNQVRFLAIDKNDQLWMLDYTGLTKYNGHSFEHFPINEQISFSNRMFCDGDTIWFGSNMGLVKFFNEKYTLYPLKDCKSNYVNEVYRDKQGNLWVFTREESFIFKNEAPDLSSKLALNPITKIVESGEDSYVLCPEKGIYKNYFDKRSKASYVASPASPIKDFILENDGKTIWIAGVNGLTKWSGNKKQIINENNGLEYNDIKVLYIDREDVLWIGTDGNGVYKYTGDLISTYTQNDGLNSDLVMSMAEYDQSLYILTYDRGINKITDDSVYSPSAFRDFGLENGWSIVSDKSIWAGFDRGLINISKDKISTYTQKDGLYDNRQVSLYVDKINSSLLIGSEVGYTEFKDNKFNVHSIDDGFPLRRVRMIRRDDKNNLWFAGINGVARFDGENYIVYKEAEGLPSNSTYNIAFYKGNVWIGTKNGLCYLENDSSITFPLGNNSKDLSINLLINDERGKLWVGTNNGIYSINIDDNNESHLRHYGLQDGLIGLETNMNAAYLDQNGNLFFGFAKGLVRFDRNELEKLKLKITQKPELTKLQIYLKDIDWLKRGDSISAGNSLPSNLHLEPNENYLTFNFSAINMQNPNELKYRFMLLGAEGELSEYWSNPTSNNYATFSNLSSGSYTFKVQASTDIGAWPEEYSEYSFIINTPYYATWWFRSLIVLVFMSILYSIYSFRIKSLKQQQDNLFLQSQSKMLALEQQTLNANMNRHFVFNALNSIQYYLNKEDKISANRYLSRFAKLIRKNLDSSQSKQTTLSEEIERMILYMELEQMRFANKFEFSFDVDKNINTRDIQIPSMLFQPYLENSIWHGILPMDHMGNIAVKICSLENDSIKISIFDNGIGIETSIQQKNQQPKDHISVGMEITKNRLALYQQINKKEASVLGPFEVKKNGKTIGTQVELILPLLNDPQ